MSSIASRALPGDNYYYPPATMWRVYFTDPVRFLVVVLSCVCIGYGSRNDPADPFTVWYMENIVGAIFSGVEVILIGLIVLDVLRRLIINDWRIERSPYTAPMICLGVVMGVYPLLNMFISEGGLRTPMEIFGHPMFVACFFAFLFLFRRKEIQVMVWMVIIAGCFKSFEAITIFFSRGLGWSLLQGWRDGMLLALMLLGAAIAYAVKPEGDAVYARMRRCLFWALPFASFAFIGSMRRSYMLGAVLVIVLLLFVLRKSERRSFYKVTGVFLGLSVVGIIMFESSDIVGRLGGIYDPSTEGSASYRVLESYNTWQMILERPIFGWPYAEALRNYTNVKLHIISSIAPHNVYLYVLLRAGIFGLAAFLWLVFAMHAVSLRTIRHARTPFERFTALWMACAPPLVLFTGLTTPVIADHMQEFLPFLMVITGFLPGAFKQKKGTIAETSVPELAR